MSDCSHADGGGGVKKNKKQSVDGHQCRNARVSNAAWISVVMVIRDLLEMEGKEEKDGWSEGGMEGGRESQLADTGGLQARDLLHQMDDWSQFQAGAGGATKFQWAGQKTDDR